MSNRGRNQVQTNRGGNASVLVLPLGGAFSTIDHVVYRSIPENFGDIRLSNQQHLCGIPLGNWSLSRLIGTGFITTGDARRIRNKIEEELRSEGPGGPAHSLILVGKSAGGIKR